MSKRNKYRIAIVVCGLTSSAFQMARIQSLGAFMAGLMIGLAWAYVDLTEVPAKETTNDPA